MRIAVTALHGVTSRGVRVRGACRRAAGGAALGLGTLAGAGVLATSATLAAAWLVSGALSSNVRIQAQTAFGPRTVALTLYQRPLPDGPEPTRVASGPADANFETRWAGVAVATPDSATPPMPRARPKTAPKTARAPENIKVAALNPATTPAALLPKPAAKTANVLLPLPRPNPAAHDIARSPAAEAKTQATLATQPRTQLATAAPPETTGSIPRDPVEPAHEKVTLPKPGSRVAVYDISARTVYLPSGDKLEAHSGLGDKMDNPRYVHVRMRGATPPNVYDLRMRESLFHGVAAIRLKPVNEDKMFGRDGILAHTYMLGPNGQSNGCVSFKNYAAFLRSFQKGEIERLVVVAKLGDTMPNLDTTPSRIARASVTRRWRVADSRPAAPKQAPLTGQW